MYENKKAQFLAFSDDLNSQGIAKKEFTVLKYGRSDYTINGEKNSFDFSEDDADIVMTEFNTRGRDILMDYDHATLNEKQASNGNAPATSFWKLSKGEKGLMATIEGDWTPKAKAQLEAREYKYFSPVIEFDKDKKPCGIHSIAITNHPAVHNCETLIAANDIYFKAKKNIDNNNTNNVIETPASVQTIEIPASELNNIDAFIQDEENQYNLDVASIQKAILEYKGIQEKASTMLASLMERLSNLVNDDNKVEIASFSDSVFADSMNLQTHIIAMNDLGSKKNEDDDKKVHTILFSDHQKELMSFNDVIEEKNKANKRLVLKLNDKQKEIYAFKSKVGLKDTDSLNLLTDRLQSFSDMEKEKNEFLQSYNCLTLSDVTKKFDSIQKEKQKIIDIKNAERAVEVAMNDGKLTFANKEWGMEFATENLKRFNDFMKNSPQVFTPFQMNISKRKEFSQSQVSQSQIEEEIDIALNLE